MQTSSLPSYLLSDSYKDRLEHLLRWDHATKSIILLTDDIACTKKFLFVCSDHAGFPQDCWVVFIIFQITPIWHHFGLSGNISLTKYFSSNIRYTKNSVVYEIISTLPLPADNHTLDAGADDLASLAAVSTRERTESTSEEMWDPNTAFDRYVKVAFSLAYIFNINWRVFNLLKESSISSESSNKLLFIDFLTSSEYHDYFRESETMVCSL